MIEKRAAYEINEYYKTSDRSMLLPLLVALPIFVSLTILVTIFWVRTG